MGLNRWQQGRDQGQAFPGRSFQLNKSVWLASKIIRFVRAGCLEAKFPLCIIRGRAAGVSHHMFSRLLALLYPCLGGAS
jgi:hypothetical protein